MVKSEKDLLYWAWTIIANAHEGDWKQASPKWSVAAEMWRDEWHDYLDQATKFTEPQPNWCLIHGKQK